MAAGDVITIQEDNIARKGVYFDGTDDYTLVDAHAVARVAANDTVGTYSAWIYLGESPSGNVNILSAGDNNSATEYLSWYINSARLLYFKVQQGGGERWKIHSTSDTVPVRTWTHVTIVQNGTSPQLYINGNLVSKTVDSSTDITDWYDELTGCDKFAIGVLESNNTHTQDFTGAIGQVKYWNKALTDAEVLADYKGEALSDDGTYLQLNLTMEDDGITDSGLGADNGTLTGHAHYGGYISSRSMALERNCTGHAAEFIYSFQDGDKQSTIIKRGD